MERETGLGSDIERPGVGEREKRKKESGEGEKERGKWCRKGRARTRIIRNDRRRVSRRVGEVCGNSTGRGLFKARVGTRGSEGGLW